MGHSTHHQHHHHQAADGLVNLLTKANHDLTLVQLKLDKEFQQVYPDSVCFFSSQILLCLSGFRSLILMYFANWKVKL